jgi:MHS family shikimate/dehydroshikimate transporter-like MFS transporter
MKSSKTSTVRTVAASTVGTIFEWYDFVIFSLATVLVFNKLFFPNVEAGLALMVAMLAYAVGIVARPLGGLIYGAIGDRYGRKRMLVSTMLIMGVSTFAIGLLPTYDTIGVWAPILLIVLRIIQGIGIGGEWGGASVMIQEHAPDGQRGFYASFIQTGLPAGMLMASSIFAFLTWQLTEAEFLDWGWRIPFLLSAVLVVIGTVIRYQIPETPVFEDMNKKQNISRNPVKDVFFKYPGTLLKGIGLKLTESVWFFIVTGFIVGYAVNSFDIPRKDLLQIIMLANAISILWTIGIGYLSDRIGRRAIFFFGSIFTMIMPFPIFYLVGTGDFYLIAVAMIIGQCIGSTTMFAVLSSWLPEMFHSSVRSTGSSLSFQIGAAITGGLIPVLAAWSVGYWGSNYGLVGVMMLFGLLTLIATLKTKETSMIATKNLND